MTADTFQHLAEAVLMVGGAASLFAFAARVDEWFTRNRPAEDDE